MVSEARLSCLVGISFIVVREILQDQNMQVIAKTAVVHSSNHQILLKPTFRGVFLLAMEPTPLEN